MTKSPTTPLSEIKRTGPTYVIVTQHLREQILAGKWAPNTQIPSIKELSRMLGTNFGTTYKAITPLVKEGLLLRVQGSGTFVVDRSDQTNGQVATASPDLSHSVADTAENHVFRPAVPYTATGRALRAAVYYSQDPVRNSDRFLQDALRDHLRQELSSAGIEMELLVDSRNESEQTTLFPALQAAVEKGEISSVICPSVTATAFRTLQNLSIPITGLYPIPTRNWVAIHNNLFEVAVADLHNRGATSIAVLSHIVNDGLVERGPHNRAPEGLLENSFYVRFQKAVERDGLACTRCSIHAPPEPNLLDLERFAYSRFKQLWNSKERPEGIIIYSDAIARGAVMAMLELGVKVPEEAKIVIHHTSEVDFICPLELTFLEFSVKSLAEAFLNQIHRQMRAEPTPPLHVPIVSLKR